ncbi:hypothetical protein SOVF_173960 [Spinacia oleracea]|uniref:Ethylene-responsive transcription factor ERF017-like n=1 Tax=Spinacia oleracea TaxID=3562 RepID=A0A9R0J0B4_SPIOL|nr:ethylene-responsive transcription factor ERF017-like [Spinacia oleracea]KNA07212.1 hypothetical protein SOVF_173960 [Spinacia oleracea]
MVKKTPEYENKVDNSIKYKGVRKRKWGKWVSEIRLPNSRERIWLGSYDSAEKAARAFDAAQFCLRGKSANFNFPDNPPEIAGGRGMTPSEIQAAAARFANLSSSSEAAVVGGSCGGDQTIRDEPTVEESMSYSPSFSDGATVQMDCFDVVSGVETSFHEQLSLSTTLGSGNFASDFGYFTGYDDFTAGNYFTTPQQTDNNFGYVGEDDTYDASLYQDSYLWNF